MGKIPMPLRTTDNSQLRPPDAVAPEGSGTGTLRQNQNVESASGLAPYGCIARNGVSVTGPSRPEGVNFQPEASKGR